MAIGARRRRKSPGLLGKRHTFFPGKGVRKRRRRIHAQEMLANPFASRRGRRGWRAHNDACICVGVNGENAPLTEKTRALRPWRRDSAKLGSRHVWNSIVTGKAIVH